MKRPTKHKISMVISGSKTIQCITCQSPCKVAHTTVQVTCWRCVNKIMGPPEIDTNIIKDPKSDMPKGWRRRKQYVHTDGSVYEHGIENLELMGTLPTTYIQPKPVVPKVKNKLTIFQKGEERKHVLSEISFLKGLIMQTPAKREQKKINKKITELTKQLAKL